MPGHKGLVYSGPEGRDITEITGADVLYHPEGIIRESEENATELFGTGKTVYSTEGSSLPIRAMLYMLKAYALQNGKRPIIAAGRNAHKVFVSAAALMDIEVSWLWPEGDGEGIVSCAISPERLEKWLSSSSELPAAVYITSPDYLGSIADIKGIAEVCHAHGCLLVVDNAHGSYLKFLPEDRHPITLGADLCCDSAHKTLPALTGGAYLHVSKNASELFSDQAEQAMALFASTSPSYLILQSLDRCNLYLGQSRPRLAKAAGEWSRVKDELRSAGYELFGDEPLKLTIRTKSYGYLGTELAKKLEGKNIFCEFSDRDNLVMMLPVEYDAGLPERIAAELCQIPRREAIKEKPPLVPAPEKIISLNKALYSPSELILTEDAAGRIMADPCVSCPPAVPVVVYGERISAEAIEAMKYYGINTIRVIKQ